MKFLKKPQDHGNDQTTRLMIFRLSCANDSCFFDTFIFFPHPAFLSSLYHSDYFRYFRYAHPFLEGIQNQVLRSKL